MPRTRRSREDEIGQRLIQAGAHLLRTGTALEELRLTDAAMLANVTTGAAYPRFRGQGDFRREVTIAVLRDSPKHRDEALDAIAEVVANTDAPLTVDDIPKLIESVAGRQQEAIRHDTGLAVRLYALSRLAFTDMDDGSGEIRRELQEHDKRMAEEWRGTLKVICTELGIEPAAESLELEDFEIACSCLLMGLAIRQRTSPDLPRDIYPRLVMALAAGFFDVKPPEGTAPRRTRDLRAWLTQKLTRGSRRNRRPKRLPQSQEKLGQLVEEARLPRLPEFQVSRDELLGKLASEPIKRALADLAPLPRGEQRE
jgi:hypothetical protein